MTGSTSWAWVAVVGGALALLATSQTVSSAIVWLANRGRRLTRTTQAADGAIYISPADLAAAAAAVVGRPVTVEAYALARMVHSEEGSQSPEVKVAVAHVAINDRDERPDLWRGSLLKLFTYSNHSGESGWFGDQAGRRFATSRDPYEIDLQVAETVLAGRTADPTGGATKFVRGFATLEKVRESWGQSGLEPFNLPGTPSDLYFFRRA